MFQDKTAWYRSRCLDLSWYTTCLAKKWRTRNPQIREKDFGWGKFVLDHLPDDEDDDDLTQDNNRCFRPS